MKVEYPCCNKCQQIMVFAGTCYNKTNTKKISQWHCSNGHNNRYAYTGFIPYQYIIECEGLYAWNARFPFIDLEDVRIFLALIKWEAGTLKFVRIYSIQQKQHIKAKEVLK